MHERSVLSPHGAVWGSRPRTKVRFGYREGSSPLTFKGGLHILGQRRVKILCDTDPALQIARFPLCRVPRNRHCHGRGDNGSPALVMILISSYTLPRDRVELNLPAAPGGA